MSLQEVLNMLKINICRKYYKPINPTDLEKPKQEKGLDRSSHFAPGIRHRHGRNWKLP
jgi:hypothetical protein